MIFIFYFSYLNKMSLNQLYSKVPKPWLSIRANTLHPSGFINYIPQPQIAGGIFGILDGATGELGILPAPTLPERSYIVYEYQAAATPMEININFLAQKSPITSKFTNVSGVITINESGIYLAHLGVNITGLSTLSKLRLKKNGVTIQEGDILATTINASGTFIHTALYLNAGDTISISILNSGPGIIATLNNGIITLIKFSNQ